MIKLADFVVLLFLFVICSAAVFLLMVNIGVSNTNLDNASIDDLNNMINYNTETTNPFGTQVSYSLSNYSNTPEFAQSNIETKGALESILTIFGDNSLSAFTAPLNFAINMIPLPEEAYNWTFATILGLVGILVFIAAIAAWKAGVWG